LATTQPIAVTRTSVSSVQALVPRTAAADLLARHVDNLPAEPDEVLVVDSRAGLTPKQQVESKLVRLLRSTPRAVHPVGAGKPRPGI
jgi:hypothetical protein